MTLFEQAAIAAMQALIPMREKLWCEGWSDEIKQAAMASMADEAVTCAEALIDALNRHQNKPTAG